MLAFIFGSEQSDHLRFSFDESQLEKYGWIEAEVSVAAEAFHGAIKIIFELYDLRRFTIELVAVYETLNGQAKFTHRDRQLEFVVKGNGRGTIVVDGCAFARPTWGNKLEFSIELDQTFLLQPLSILRSVGNINAESRA